MEAAKKFSCDLVTTWFSNKNFLLLQGKYGELLKENLLLAIEQSDNYRNNVAHSTSTSVCQDECKSVQNSSFVKERMLPSIEEQCSTKTIADKLLQDGLNPGSFCNLNLDILKQINITYSGTQLNEAQVRNSDPSIPMQNSLHSNLEKTLSQF